MWIAAPLWSFSLQRVLRCNRRHLCCDDAGYLSKQQESLRVQQLSCRHIAFAVYSASQWVGMVCAPSYSAHMVGCCRVVCSEPWMLDTSGTLGLALTDHGPSHYDRQHVSCILLCARQELSCAPVRIVLVVLFKWVRTLYP